ncbi:MAG: DNA-binding response regulator [Betaproteobacteria bacterium HGW-Betaproteobacteria-12]|nr:MAG: DNA-binding response regulator [Betaproteobacteria bacterium HGW-Betaproteobacteria-12]
MTDADSGKQILIVEDDPDVARTIEQVLGSFGFQTAWCRSGGELLRRLRSLAPDLCIVDLGLPDMDGLEAMQRLRAQTKNCGILILTGRADVSDRVMGLELGADDYVLKPFEPRELVARVRSILRRREGVGAAAASDIAEFAGWQFNPGNNALRGPDGQQHLLSTAEAELLGVFIRHPNRILQREKLMGSRDLNPTDRAIDVRISRLRRKLEPDPHSPALIKTVYGAGYLFMATVRWLPAP